jgi:hypothetical protein
MILAAAEDRMKRFVEETDRGQSTLFPECLADWIEENNPVQVIDSSVDELDLAALEFDGVCAGGDRTVCRGAGVGEIALGLAMLKRAKRALHIDPPASSNAIMRTARPYRGENPDPGKDVSESLPPRPELENGQDLWLTHQCAQRTKVF